MGPHRRRDDRPYRPRSGELPRSDVNPMAVWSQYGYNRRTVAYPGTVSTAEAPTCGVFVLRFVAIRDSVQHHTNRATVRTTSASGRNSHHLPTAARASTTDRRSPSTRLADICDMAVCLRKPLSRSWPVR